MINYTFQITNLTDNELTFVVNDVLPDGVTFDEAQNLDWRRPPSIKELGRSVIQRRLTLLGGQTILIALRLRAHHSGILKNFASLLLFASDDPVFGYIAPTHLGSSEVESEVTEIEGDVNGDGVLSPIDSSWALGIAAGQVMGQPGIVFQNTDSAPRNTKGDSKLDLKDAVQAGRYVGNIDIKTSAGGPTAPNSGLSQSNSDRITTWLGSVAGQTRTLRALNASFVRGDLLC